MAYKVYVVHFLVPFLVNQQRKKRSSHFSISAVKRSRGRRDTPKAGTLARTSAKLARQLGVCVGFEPGQWMVSLSIASASSLFCTVEAQWCTG